MALAAAMLLAGATAPAQVAPIDVQHYRVRLQPDIAAGTLRGEEDVRLCLLGDGDTVSLDAGALSIDGATLGKHALPTSREGKTLAITLPRAYRAGACLTVRLHYSGKGSYGLQLHADRRQAYTIFSTSQWMPANDAPADRATLDLDVALPGGLRAIGTGDALAVRHAGGSTTHRWRLRQAMPSYLYGFAAGTFTHASFEANGITFELLGDGFDAVQLQRIFADTPAMLAFFADKAGVPYPHRVYSQALVADTVGQELAGMALVSEAYGREVLADPTRQGLIAHEAAHQWWGNGATNLDWRQFWLNEGITTFMAAAWMQHRFGDAAYDAQVERWRTRVGKLRADGKDKPLVFPDWNKPSGDDRAVVYSKGAYAMHLLREQLGEDAFWKGLRAYTRTHMGKTATTADLQQAMQAASGRDLSEFFREWAGVAD
ncbi:MAG TPA: M1 family metallopeptidase [Thermomonas sp.]|nr:M1 family metallopeptidase [Thermomonas sp.]